MADILYLIRHGEVAEKFQGRYIGTTDAPLSEAGRAACEPLRSLVCDRIYTSPLRRAVETAAFPVGELHQDPRLAEIDFGAWENLSFAEIAAIAGIESLEIWSKAPEEMIFPGGESVRDFFARVDRCFAEIAACDAGRVAIVTHGGVLMRILARLAGLPTARQQEVLPPRGACVRLIKDHSGVWRHDS